MRLTEVDLIEKIYTYYDNILDRGEFVYDEPSNMFVGQCSECREIIDSKSEWFKDSDICIECSKKNRGEN